MAVADPGFLGCGWNGRGWRWRRAPDPGGRLFVIVRWLKICDGKPTIWTLVGERNQYRIAGLVSDQI